MSRREGVGEVGIRNKGTAGGGGGERILQGYFEGMKHLLVKHSCLWMALSCLLCFTGCRKELINPLDMLPPVTASGANTWGCLINGKYARGTGERTIRGDWTTSDGCSVQMNVVSLGFPDTTRRYALIPGHYTLAAKAPRQGWASLTRPANYDDSQLIDGYVKITRLDQQAAIISGTFEFTMVGSPGDTVRVTNGRFDTHMDL